MSADALLAASEQGTSVVSQTEHRSFASYFPDWYDYAACAGEEADVFFGQEELSVRPPLTIAQVRRAQLICARCPVFNQCLEHALTTPEEYGIWATTTRNMRLKIKREIETGKTTLSDVISTIVTLRSQMVRRVS